MAKGFRLRLSFPSIRLCRSKMPFVVSPPIFTPLNPKVFDITYPKLPAPPSTPIHPTPTCRITPIMDCPSKLSPICEISRSNADSPAFQKLFNSPVLEDTVWPTHDWHQNTNEEREINMTENNNDDQSQDIDSFLTSFSMSFPSVEPDGMSCSDLGYSLKTINEAKAYAIKRRRGSPVCPDDDDQKTTVMEFPDNNKSALSTSPVKNTVFGKLMPCMVEGKVNESYAVMKKSEDPYDDFKKSMMEMILEKQISEAEDLEKLLMCFLSLNAKDHHQVIVEAFSEVWEELYYKS